MTIEDQVKDHHKRLEEIYKDSERRAVNWAVWEQRLAMQKILLEWQKEGLNPCEDFINFNNAVELEYQIRIS